MRRRKWTLAAVLLVAGALLLTWGVWVAREAPPKLAGSSERMGATLRERAGSSAIGPAVLQGLVRGADGQPVPGARICAVDSESDSAGIPQATCVAADAQGRYALMLPLAGVFSIAANAPGYEPGRARNGEAARPGERASLEHGTTRQPAGPLRQ